MRLASLFVLGVLALGGCQHAPTGGGVEVPPAGQAWLSEAQVRDQKIEFAPVDEQDVDDTVVTAGRFAFDDARVAHVYSPVNGKVTQLGPALGQRVKKGDLLAVIDSPDIGQFTSDVGKAQADVIAAEHDYNRKKELFADHACSQADLETSEDNYHKAQAELERAKQKMRSLHGQGSMVNQGYAVTAPIDGEVISRGVSPGIEVQGQYSGANVPLELYTLGEIDRLWMMADVYEVDLARVKVGAKVSVKVVAFPKEVFEGKLDWVSGTLDKDTRTIKVRCVFENPSGLLKPEMYATASISVEERKALALPRDAVLHMGDQTVIFVDVGRTPDGRVKLERRPVAVDDTEVAAWLPVTHGVDKGERVAVAPSTTLSGLM